MLKSGKGNRIQKAMRVRHFSVAAVYIGADAHRHTQTLLPSRLSYCVKISATPSSGGLQRRSTSATCSEISWHVHRTSIQHTHTCLSTRTFAESYIDGERGMQPVAMWKRIAVCVSLNCISFLFFDVRSLIFTFFWHAVVPGIFPRSSLHTQKFSHHCYVL